MSNYLSEARDSSLKSAIDCGVMKVACPVILVIIAMLFSDLLTIWLVFCLIALSRIFHLFEIEYRALARRLDQGLAAEDDVEGFLSRLPSGWTYLRNIKLPKAGDLDFLIVSPDKQYFAAEVKSHRGKFQKEGNTLVRAGKFKLECDFVRQAARQAVMIKEHLKLPFVSPLVILVNAKLEIENPRIGVVDVMTLSELGLYLLEPRDRTRLRQEPHQDRQLALQQEKYRESDNEITLNEEKPKPIESDSKSRKDSERKRLAALLHKWRTKLAACYRAKLHQCYDCHSLIAVFDWPEHELYQKESPPKPKPASIREHSSRQAKTRYWANTCQVCQAVQGDFFVYEKASDYNWYCISELSELVDSNYENKHNKMRMLVLSPKPS